MSCCDDCETDLSPLQLIGPFWWWIPFIMSRHKKTQGKCLTEEPKIIISWTEHCSYLYNYETCGKLTVGDYPQIPDEEPLPILQEEVEESVKRSQLELIIHQQN